MLRISEVESGARRAGFTSVDLAQVMTDAVEFYEPLADEKGVSPESGNPTVPRRLPGDPSLLFEAVGNLIDNAIKFTPSGGRVMSGMLSDRGGIGVEVMRHRPWDPLP